MTIIFVVDYKKFLYLMNAYFSSLGYMYLINKDNTAILYLIMIAMCIVVWCARMFIVQASICYNNKDKHQTKDFLKNFLIFAICITIIFIGIEYGFHNIMLSKTTMSNSSRLAISLILSIIITSGVQFDLWSSIQLRLQKEEKKKKGGK